MATTITITQVNPGEAHLWQGLIYFIFAIFIISLVAGIIMFATQDANKRGFSDGKVFLLRLVLLFTLPVGLILYLVLRPALKATPQT